MNAPAPQLVSKPQRMTKAKREALDALADLGSNFIEWGTPPYAVSQIAEQMRADLANVSKTMQGLERMGLVVREVRKVMCWNAIAREHMPRRCVCYWLANTMAQDKVSAQAWLDGAGERANRAFERMFEPRQVQTIDVQARVIDSP